MRNRFVPDSLQADADGSGHSIFRSTGRRTTVASGRHSPVTPLLTMRYRSGPNAEAPNTLAGSSVATTILEFCNVMAPLRVSRTVDAEPSVVATSILSSWENAAGDWARNENVSCESCGSSSRLERWMLPALAAGGPSLLPIRIALGRGD